MTENKKWVCAWGTTPVKFDPNVFVNFGHGDLKAGLPCLTFRTHLRLTLKAEEIRITLSNEFGKHPLTVNEVTAANGFENSQTKIRKDTLQSVTFKGKREVTIPAGETVTSDPVKISAEALGPIVISSFIKKSGVMRTFGMIGGHTHAQFGSLTKSKNILGSPMKLNGAFGEYAIIPLIKNIEVLSSDASCAVFIGDSTIANEIPYLISRKMHENGIHNIGVIQQAVKGNRLSFDGAGKLGMAYGESMVKRFNRDAINQSGVKYIFIKVGDNDIIHPQCMSMKKSAPYVSFEDMKKDYTALIDAAHENGIKVIMIERTPWRGYTRNLLGKGDDVTWTKEIDALRKSLNAWIESSDCPADGFYNLDFLSTDSTNEEMKKDFTTDGIHFTPLGQRMFADNFPLDLF